MERRLTALWYGPPGAGALLEPLARVFGTAVRVRRSAYARGWLGTHRAGKPVVVVGNLTVGGTGKTPLAVWLVEALRQRGIEVGVLSRGYGRRTSTREPRVVLAQSRWEEVGDEPWLIHHRAACAMVVAADRAAGAQRLAAEPVDAILCDDGLQHLALARDCEIAVIDGARGLGNGRLLPAGPLREPPGRLAGVDLVVVNGASGSAPAVERWLRGLATPVVRMDLEMGLARRVDGQGAPERLDAFRSGRVHAVAGIGHPERFFTALEAQGLDIVRHPFPDHHAFRPGELDFRDAWPVLMTEKDAVRCLAFATPRTWLVPVTARLADADARLLLERVCQRIDAARRGKR